MSDTPSLCSWVTPAGASIVAAFVMFTLAGTIAAFGPQYDVTLLVTVGLTAIAAMGLTFLLIAGQVSLGQAAFMAMGAYVSAILARDYNLAPVVALFVGVAASAIAGVVVGAVTLRLKGHFLPLATLAMASQPAPESLRRVELPVVPLVWVKFRRSPSDLWR
jgi:branched-chain amino acid transport system permease protein